MPISRRTLFAAALTSAGAVIAAPHVARAQPLHRLRMATSWPRNMPGPGVSARRIAERIAAMSGGALKIDVFGAGEIVPALQTFDAVSNGSVEMAHTAALFWGGKMPAAPLFTTYPFGPGPIEHLAWLAGEGQALWDELYAPHRVKAFIAGNTGPSAAGWFRREIKSLDDVKGLRIRVTGLGGEVYAVLGAVPMALPPADTYAALERGTVDAVELLAPANDMPLGFDRIAPFCAFPGFNKPNGPSELLIARPVWDKLGTELQSIVEHAAHAEHAAGLAEAHTANISARNVMAANGKSRIVQLPEPVLVAARAAAEKVLDRVANTSPLAGRIVSSLRRG